MTGDATVFFFFYHEIYIRFLCDVCYVFVCRWKNRCRRWVPAEDGLIDRLQKVVDKYENKIDRSGPHRKLYLDDFDKTHAATLRLIRDGLLKDPIAENMYFDISKDGEDPKFVTKRGSSQLEALWRALERITTGPMCSPETFDNILIDFLVLWNLRVGAEHRSSNGGKILHTCDLGLLYRIKENAKELEFKDPFPDLQLPPGTKKLIADAPIKETEFYGAGHSHRANVAIQFMNEYIRRRTRRGDELPPSEKYMDKMTGARGFPTAVKGKDEEMLYEFLEPKFRVDHKKHDNVDFGITQCHLK